MLDDKSAPCFFLGANSPCGFVSRFDSLYDPEGGWHAFVLKGGPGTGKSTLMHRVAAAAQEAHAQVERIHCSSDPASLDAVILPGQKLCIVDGTAPHAWNTDTHKILSGMASRRQRKKT